MNYLSSLFILYKNNYRVVVLTLIFFTTLYTYLNLYQVPVYYIPDLAIFFFAIYALININQDISRLINISFILLIYYLCFSPARLDVEFDNKYYVTLKPLGYLCILYLTSKYSIRFPIRKSIYTLLILYPLMLVWSIFIHYMKEGSFLRRPYFIFENNFEIPLILACFVITSFIYKDKDFKVFLLVCLSVFLTGSRSGLIGFVLVALPHLFSLGKKKFIIGFSVFSFVVAYLIYVRGLPAFSFNSIDRVQTFKGMFAYFNNDVFTLLSYPFGVGVYSKIPIIYCNPTLGPWAEWFTGTFFNCDPLLLQAYFTRSIFQLGAYVTFYIPLAFFWEIKRRMTVGLSLLILAPTLAVSLSAGGFSNGLSFISIMICLLAYRQNQEGNDVINYYHQ